MKFNLVFVNNRSRYGIIDHFIRNIDGQFDLGARFFSPTGQIERTTGHLIR